MSAAPFFSIVVPVYNRPDELGELLESLASQTYREFEVIVVEDGSSISSHEVVNRFAASLAIHYFEKPNSGPGPSRNYGFEKTSGQYLVVFDSDCIIPSHYLQTVFDHLQQHPCDAWGGPDRGHQHFTPHQQAMAYTMSSVLTTGGIRGNQKHVGDFQPRSFNMGFSRKVFDETRGFRLDRFAEDIELSIRIKKAGFITHLIPEAFVYHKRRTSFGQFFKQVFNFGRGRVIINRVHPGSIKITHWFPFLFSFGLISAFISFLVHPALGRVGLSIFGVYFLIVFFHAWRVTTRLQVALLCLPAILVQMTGYGLGFFSERLGLLRS